MWMISLSTNYSTILSGHRTEVCTESRVSSSYAPFRRPHTRLPQSKLPTLPDIAHVEDALLRDPVPFQRRLQQLRRLQHVLLRQDPRAPVDAHRAPTARVLEDVHAIDGVRVHGGEEEAGMVGADGDEAEVEGPAQGADLPEGRAAG